MDKDDAVFLKQEILPIIRESADEPDHRLDRNPLRPMLKQVIRYVGYLETQRRPEVPHEEAEILPGVNTEVPDD